MLLAEHLEESPVSANDIKVWAERDQEFFSTLNGGSLVMGTQSVNLTPHVISNFPAMGAVSCRVIPPQDREAVLLELHEGHPGITHMKSLARMYVWWPGTSADIEKSVRLCHECQHVQSSPPLAPLHPWKWPTRFAVPFQSKNILAAVDAI